MSISFYLKDINKQGDLTVKEFLDIDKNISQFTFDINHENFQTYINNKLSSYICILVGEKGNSARGFEVSYSIDENKFTFRMFTPSSIGDWETALNLMYTIGKKFGIDEITDENEMTYNTEDIRDFNFTKNALMGISMMSDFEKFKNFSLPCVVRPFTVSKEIAIQLKESENSVALFSKLLTDIQNIEAYDAKQRLFNVDNNIVGVYTITEGVKTILPFSPIVDFEIYNTVKNEDVSSWLMTFVYVDGDENDPNAYKILGRINYTDFTERLPKDKYVFLDGCSILIENLDKVTMEKILATN